MLNSLKKSKGILNTKQCQHRLSLSQSLTNLAEEEEKACEEFFTMTNRSSKPFTFRHIYIVRAPDPTTNMVQLHIRVIINMFLKKPRTFLK